MDIEDLDDVEDEDDYIYQLALYAERQRQIEVFGEDAYSSPDQDGDDYDDIDYDEIAD